MKNMLSHTQTQHPTPSATIQKVENSHHQSDVVVMVLDTKGGFRRCQWLLLVVLLMMGTTKLLMKGHLVHFCGGKDEAKQSQKVKKSDYVRIGTVICMVFLIGICDVNGYGGVGVLIENIVGTPQMDTKEAIKRGIVKQSGDEANAKYKKSIGSNHTFE
eukprot:598265_1